MTMKKRIKTAGALTLAAITVLSAAGLSSVYGALGVETDRKCSLTFTLDDTEFDELRDLEISVDVYKVADITEEVRLTMRSHHQRSVLPESLQCQNLLRLPAYSEHMRN